VLNEGMYGIVCSQISCLYHSTDDSAADYGKRRLCASAHSLLARNCTSTHSILQPLSSYIEPRHAL
jgi:hypothetical protein